MDSYAAAVTMGGGAKAAQQLCFDTARPRDVAKQLGQDVYGCHAAASRRWFPQGATAWPMGSSMGPVFGINNNDLNMIGKSKPILVVSC